MDWWEFRELCGAYDSVFERLLKRYYRNSPKLMAPGKSVTDYSRFKLTKKDKENIALIRAFLAEHKEDCDRLMNCRGFIFQPFIKWMDFIENLNAEDIEYYLKMFEAA